MRGFVYVDEVVHIASRGMLRECGKMFDISVLLMNVSLWSGD